MTIERLTPERDQVTAVTALISSNRQGVMVQVHCYSTSARPPGTAVDIIGIRI